MAVFQIRVPEKHYAYYEVEAEDAVKAKELVRDGAGELLQVEYSDTLGTPEEWEVL